jgi:citrate synthase/citryl-CoA lyase
MSQGEWTSGITQIQPNQVRIRGYRVEALMSSISFSQAIYLLFRGELPSEGVSELMDAILVACIDHGATTPSSLAARTSASTGAPLNAALAAGVLSINRFHGAAIQDCMTVLLEGIQQAKREKLSLDQTAGMVLQSMQAEKRRIPGLGHRVHTDDPRTHKLFEMAEQLGVSGEGAALLKALQTGMKREGKELPINVDGAIAALLVDLGFPAELGNAFFIIARIPGLAAQVYEEQTQQRPMRRIWPEGVAYDGPPPRELENGGGDPSGTVNE